MKSPVIILAIFGALLSPTFQSGDNDGFEASLHSSSSSTTGSVGSSSTLPSSSYQVKTVVAQAIPTQEHHTGSGSGSSVNDRQGSVHTTETNAGMRLPISPSPLVKFIGYQTGGMNNNNELPLQHMHQTVVPVYDSRVSHYQGKDIASNEIDDASAIRDNNNVPLRHDEYYPSGDHKRQDFPDFPMTSGGDGPSGFSGPHPPPSVIDSFSPFEPLPPAPPTIEGTVDYILIPLVLIGIAGPIFVVLYVILGAFETKMTPISRSLQDLGTYKPYLDNVISAAGRVLEKDDCLDYAACKLGHLCNTMGLTEGSILEKILESLTPQSYQRSVKTLFATKGPGVCSLKKCIKTN